MCKMNLIDFLQAETHKGVFFCCLFANSLFLFSCSYTPRQYSTGTPASPDRTLYDVPEPLTEPSRPYGGLLPYQKQELSEEEKDIKIRQNSLAPIDYENGSAGNISVETSYEEVLDILTLAFLDSDRDIHIYREGLAVRWNPDSPRIPFTIRILDMYQGSIDFGPWIGEDKRYVKVGQSFANQFSLGVEDIQKDEKAVSFITSLYKYLEDPEEENCLINRKCRLLTNSQGNFIVFDLPKMIFLFGNNERHKLTQIVIKNLRITSISDGEPVCSGVPFDLLRAYFLCRTSEDGSPAVILSMNEDYKSVVQKFKIPSDAIIVYENEHKYLLQQAAGGIAVGWKRENFEEKPKSIPEDSYLSFLQMDRGYGAPFYLDGSLVRVRLKGNNDVELIRDPPKMDALQKTQSEGSFYFSTNMPEIKGNYTLQRNLIKALLDLLRERYENYFSVKEGFKIYTRVFGGYDDKTALQARGLLKVIISEERSPLALNIAIEESSGNATVNIHLLDNDFEEYIVKNQEPLDLHQTVKRLAGFALGDKIYLRNKDIGARTAIAAYPVGDGHTLKALFDYSSEAITDVVYESGEERNISFQESSIISIPGVTFAINPSFLTKEIDGHIFEEYEINNISVTGHSFFGEINNLCSIDGFQVEMGLYDRFFTQNLIHQVSQARSPGGQADKNELLREGVTIPGDTESTAVPKEDAGSDVGVLEAGEGKVPKAGLQAATGDSGVLEEPEETNFDGCFYISPQDDLFSSLKSSYFFPRHRLVLGFEDRELSVLSIYKEPSEIEHRVGADEE